MTGVASPIGPASMRGWAHREGVIDLRLNGTVLDADAAMQRQLVVETLYRWGIAYDEGRLDVVASLFTGDGRLEVLNGSATPVTLVQGREAIARSVQASLDQQGDQRRHFITNVIVEQLNETGAILLAYSLVAIAGDPVVLGATVVYRAELRREADQVWRFSRLVIGLDAYVGPMPTIDTNGESVEP